MPTYAANDVYDAMRAADKAGDIRAVHALAAHLKAQDIEPSSSDDTSSDDRRVATYTTTDRNKKTVSFEAPADADDTTVRRLAAKAIGDRRYLGSRVKRLADKVEPEPRTQLEQIVRPFGLVTRNAVEGLSSIPDLAFLPDNLVATALGQKDVNTPFGDFGKRIADFAGLPSAENDGERLIGSALTGAFSAAGFAGGAKLASKGGSAVAAQLAKQPVAQTVSGASASGAGEFVRQKEGGPGLQTLAAIGGGVLAPVAATATSQGARQMLSLVSQKGAKDRASGLLNNFATADPATIADRIRYAPTPVSGSSPTLAEVSRDAGLAGLQRGQANTNPQAGAVIGERWQQNAIARTNVATEALGPGSPQRLQDIGRNQLQKARADTAAQRQGGQQRVGPVVDRTATAANVRTAFTENYDAAKARTRDAYADPSLVARIPVDIPADFFKGIKNTADDFYGDGGGIMPPEVQSIISDLADSGTTTRTLSNIDRRLADFAGQAQMAGRRSDAAFANRIRGQLTEQINAIATPEYRTAIDAARTSRADMGRVFETGDAAKALATDRFGNPTIGDTKLPVDLFRPGAPGGDTADGLIAASSPQAAEAVARQEFRRLMDAAQTPDQASALVRRYNEALSRFPALRADAENWAASMSPSSAETALSGTPLARVADEGVEPSSYVGQLLRANDGGRQMSTLVKQIGDDPEAVNGARRAFAEFIESSGKGPGITAAGDNVPSINPTRKAISTVLDRGKSLLNGQQRIVLERVQKELDGASFAASAGRPTGSDTAMNKTVTGIIGKQILGKTGPFTNMLGHVLSLVSNKEQVQRLITEAILDPKFASELLMRRTPKRMTIIGQRIQSTTTGTVSGFRDEEPQ